MKDVKCKARARVRQTGAMMSLLVWYFKHPVEARYSLPLFGQYFTIPEPRKFSEVTKLSENINKHWLKASMKDIKNIINNQNFHIEDQNEGEPVTLCMDVYKAKIQSDGSIDKLI